MYYTQKGMIDFSQVSPFRTLLVLPPLALFHLQVSSKILSAKAGFSFLKQLPNLWFLVSCIYSRAHSPLSPYSLLYFSPKWAPTRPRPCLSLPSRSPQQLSQPPLVALGWHSLHICCWVNVVPVLKVKSVQVTATSGAEQKQENGGSR